MNHTEHVLMTADTVGGVWTFAIELAAALMNQGTQVTIAATGGTLSDDQRCQVRIAGSPEVIESSFRLEWQDDPWDDVRRTGDWLRDIADRVNPDVLHLNEYSIAALDWCFPTIVTAHSCVLSWYAAVRGCQAPARWNEYRRRVTEGIHAADVVTAPSLTMLRCIEQHYGRVAHGAVIPNGRSAHLFRPSPKESMIFAAGRFWDDAKNIAALTAVAPRLPWPVYVAGEERRPAVAGYYALGVLGVRAVADLMSRAAIYCLPARYEPFGLSILEAALSGCALVLGDIASLREIWDGCARFVEPDDHNALLSALMELIETPRLREELAKNARDRARRYTPENMAVRYAGVYERAKDLAFAARMSVLS